MIEGRPEKIAINHDDYHAIHIGRTSDDLQFFLTTPYELAIGDSEGCEYVALFLFDHDGNLTDAKVDSFGPLAKIDEEKRRLCYERRLHDIGDFSFERIEVKPFAIERFGTTFGLIMREPEDEHDDWSVELLPGNYMVFFEPWDSGEYDT